MDGILNQHQIKGEADRAMHPEQILHMQMDLLHRLTGQPAFQKMIEYACSASFPTTGSDQYPPDNEFGKMVADRFVSITRGAYAFRVTPDMCDVVEGVAAQLTDDDVFNRDHAPTGCGIVRFEKPILIQDIRGQTMKAHWLIWGPTEILNDDDAVTPGVAAYWLNDTADPDDVAITMQTEDPENYQKMLEIGGRWAWVGFNAYWNGMQMGPPLIRLDDDIDPERVEQYYEVLRAGDPGDRPTTGLDRLTEYALITNTKRHVHALWLLLNQTLTQVEEEPVNRQMRKAARRMNIPGRVSVIKMRRIENPHQYDGEMHVEWQHRWMVRGHLAWRRCGPDKPGAEAYEKGWRRRIWIPAYWKGPDDKPVKITDKLYDLSR